MKRETNISPLVKFDRAKDVLRIPSLFSTHGRCTAVDGIRPIPDSKRNSVSIVICSCSCSCSCSCILHHSWQETHALLVLPTSIVNADRNKVASAILTITNPNLLSGVAPHRVLEPCFQNTQDFPAECPESNRGEHVNSQQRISDIHSHYSKVNQTRNFSYAFEQ